MKPHFYQKALIIFILTFSYASLSQASTSCAGGTSPGFNLKGAVDHPKFFTPSILSQYQSSKMTVSYFSGSSGIVTKTYVGVPLYDLIKEAGLKIDPTHKNDILRKYFVIKATDCYEAIVAAAEIQPNFGGEQIMAAFATIDPDGAVLPLDISEGAVRLVVPNDKSGGRYVSNVTSIVIRSAP